MAGWDWIDFLRDLAVEAIAAGLAIGGSLWIAGRTLGQSADEARQERQEAHAAMKRDALEAVAVELGINARLTADGAAGHQRGMMPLRQGAVDRALPYLAHLPSPVAAAVREAVTAIDRFNALPADDPERAVLLDEAARAVAPAARLLDAYLGENVSGLSDDGPPTVDHGR